MVIDDQDGERHQISVASPTTARTRANPCFIKPTWAGGMVDQVLGFSSRWIALAMVSIVRIP